MSWYDIHVYSGLFNCALTWCASCSCRSGLRCIRLFPKHPWGQALSTSYFGICCFGFENPLDKIWLKCCWMGRAPQTFHPSRLASEGFQSWYVLTCFGSTLHHPNLNLHHPTRNSRLATRNSRLATRNSHFTLSPESTGIIEYFSNSSAVKCSVNPYLPSGPLHPYQLDESISNFSDIWCPVSFLLYFQ